MIRTMVSISIAAALCIVVTPSLGAQESRAGIMVRGQWELQAVNPDGSIAERREFDNGLVQGATVLADLVSRRSVAGGWSVGLIAPNSTGYGFSGLLRQGQEVTLFDDSYSQPGALVLTGSATNGDSVVLITKVTTYANYCADRVPAYATYFTCNSDAFGMSSGDTYAEFSGTVLGTPFRVEPKQIIQVRVTLTFQ